MPQPINLPPKSIASGPSLGLKGQPTRLPPVEVQGKLPNWAKYSSDFENILPKQAVLNQYLTPMAMAMGNSESNYPESIDKDYDQQKNDYIARALILDRNNDKYTNKEKEIINSSRYKGKSKEYAYNNPQHLPIGTGQKAFDLLYDNDYLLKVPGVRQIAQKFAQNTLKGADVASGTKYISQHPEIKEESTAAYGDSKFNPLKQFLGSDQGVEKSKYAPKNDYFNFMKSYSLKGKEGISKEASGFLQQFANKETIDSIKKKPIFSNVATGSESLYKEIPDIGHYKSGVAWDEQKKLPYYFVSDAWDFDPQDYSKKWGVTSEDHQRAYQQAYLLNKAGNPYKIYDRFYFEPETGEYIDDTKDTRFTSPNAKQAPFFKYPDHIQKAQAGLMGSQEKSK